MHAKPTPRAFVILTGLLIVLAAAAIVLSSAAMGMD